MSTIGFIGLGHMGNPMAHNLIKSGFSVLVYDVAPALAQAFHDTSARKVDSIAELAREASIIITSVQTGEQVNSICLGDQGIFQQAKPGTLYIDCSSIDIVTTRELHEVAALNQIAMLDAPVSGGVAGAIQATLTFMVGGLKEHFDQALPLLEKMGKKIIYAGDAGNGQAAKICNNLLLGISMIGTSEAFNLAQKLGLHPKTFFDISSNASGQCWAMTSYCPVPDILEQAPSTHDYQPGFMAKMMLKDLHLGQHAAEAVQAAIPLGAAATELYQLYVNQGFGELDFSGIINFIANKRH